MNILRKRSRSYERRLFAVMTDTHGGKTVGLLNPETVLIKADDYGSVELWQPPRTKMNDWFWSVSCDCLDELVSYAGDDEIIIGHNGDIVNGDRYDGNIPDTTREDQRTIAKDNLRPFIALPNVHTTWLVTGTAVHVIESAEARIAHDLSKETGKEIKTCHHGLFDFGQDEVEIAHHGPYPGSRDWLRGNVAFLHLKDRLYEERRHGGTPPRIYLYGHYHRRAYAADKDRWDGEVTHHELYVLPALSGLDDFSRKVARSPSKIQAGMIVLEFLDGKLNDIVEMISDLDLRTKVKM